MVDPTAASSKELFDTALNDYMKNLPAIPIIQTTYPTAFNTTYWTGWPTARNDYVQPPTWWQSSHLILHHLQPVEP